MSRILKSKLQFRIKSAFWWKWYTPMMHSKCWTVPAACSPVLCFCAHNQVPYACLCANENSSFARQRNLGEVLRGDNIVNTFYSVEIKCDKECELVCDKRRLSREECKAGGPVHPPYSSEAKKIFNLLLNLWFCSITKKWRVSFYWRLSTRSKWYIKTYIKMIWISLKEIRTWSSTTQENQSIHYRYSWSYSCV